MSLPLLEGPALMTEGFEAEVVAGEGLARVLLAGEGVGAEVAGAEGLPWGLKNAPKPCFRMSRAASCPWYAMLLILGVTGCQIRSSPLYGSYSRCKTLAHVPHMLSSKTCTLSHTTYNIVVT
jgi:hypothetical protein